MGQNSNPQFLNTDLKKIKTTSLYMNIKCTNEIWKRGEREME